MHIARDGDDYGVTEVTNWRFRELLQIERNAETLKARADAAEAAIETHRKERDRYEKASEVAMQALKQQAEAAEARVKKLEAELKEASTRHG